MNIIIKRFLAFFMSFAIIFSTTSAFAASPVGWSASPADIIMNGASATITALKGQGASALQSTIKHAPSAANIGKKMLKGGGAAAIAIAVTQIAGDSVDWVLDPANNSIRYTPSVSDPSAGDNSNRYTYNGYATPELACIGAISASANRNWSYVKVKPYPDSPNTYICVASLGGEVSDFSSFSGVLNPHYVEGGSPVGDKYIPIETVAAKVISNAAAGDAASQDLLKTVALDDVESGALDVPLNIAAVPKADAPAVPDAPPVDPNAPPVPFDPSSIIAAIKSVMAAIVNMAAMIGAKFDALIANDNVNAKAEADVAAQQKIDRDAKAKADKEFADWVKEEPPKNEEDTTVAIPDNDVLPADTDINFGGSCPANFEVNSSIFGNPINIVLLDTAKFCGFLSTFVKYPVYAVSSLFALYILGGRKDV